MYLQLFMELLFLNVISVQISHTLLLRLLHGIPSHDCSVQKQNVGLQFCLRRRRRVCEIAVLFLGHPLHLLNLTTYLTMLSVKVILLQAISKS